VTNQNLAASKTSENRPDNRLTEEELQDLKVVAATELADDCRLAMEQNFPPEQLPDWALVRERMQQGFIALHELRSVATNELLSSRMIVDYPARTRSEPQFLLVSFVVTPDGGETGNKQNKGKGYGSFLREKSMEISRRQKPHALGLIAERESTKGVTQQSDQRLRRASWMSRLGLFIVEDLVYDIAPLSLSRDKNAAYIPVAERAGAIKAADLLIYRFNGSLTIDGKSLKSIVARLYTSGYGISITDDFYLTRIALVDETREYKLIAA